jgi:uridine phosphorylase
VCVCSETYLTAKLAGWSVASQGRVYHLGVKRGEVANRILSVGDTSRARLLSGEQGAESSCVSSSHSYINQS